ncbi:hypothetical protein ACFU5O_36180 [Streptomyces sp. NPDC057445]|uniref:hypothetical protein n=1 Tax=Streptomyces sp. NPDC057445 TaxID=3346136 RepID=UPI0036C843DE
MLHSRQSAAVRIPAAAGAAPACLYTAGGLSPDACTAFASRHLTHTLLSFS